MALSVLAALAVPARADSKPGSDSDRPPVAVIDAGDDDAGGQTQGVEPGICTEPDSHCQDRPMTSTVGAMAADRYFRTADDFVAAADGVITHVCVWGAYNGSPFSGGFQVRYYLDDGANGHPDVPGTIIAEFTEANGNLLVSSPIPTGQTTGGLQVYEQVLSHPGLSVPAAQCRWIEVRNVGAVQWFWVTKNNTDPEGNNRKAFDWDRNDRWDSGDQAVRDQAFCLDIALAPNNVCINTPPATNTTCANARLIPCGGTVIANNIYGNPLVRIPPNPLLPCIATSAGTHPLWYRFVATRPSALVSACASPVRLDSALAVYRGTCSGLTLLGCSDGGLACGATPNDPTAQHGFVSLTGLTPGETYLIQLVANNTGALGEYMLSVTCPGEPSNDHCHEALPVEPGGPPVHGSTRGATLDPDAPSPCPDGVNVTAPGVWYHVLGTGNVLVASLCDGTNYDAQISVYCGDCGQLTCVNGDDDGCGVPGGPSIIQWCSQAGVDYHILVHGFNNSVGEFTLLVTEQPTPCPPNGPCRQCSIWEPNATGNWSDAFRWNPPIVPNNMFSQRFCVAIQQPASHVLLDIDATIDSLMVDEGDLDVFNGNLHIATSGGIFNRHTITVGAGKSIVADAPMSFTGPGPLHLAAVDATIRSVLGNTITNSVNHLIDGFGVIDADFVNLGRVNANVAGQTLFVRGPSLVNNGLMDSTMRGILRLEDNLGSGGGGVLRATGADFIIDTALVLADCIEVLPGSLSFFTIMGQPSSPSVVDLKDGLITGGVLSLIDHSTANVMNRILICPAVGAIAVLDVDGTSTVNGDVDLCDGGGGVIRGGGTINGDVNNSGGVISPGGSPGILNISGSYAQGSTGLLDIELGGTTPGLQYDVLSITGPASLAGTLRLTLVNGYVPVSGDMFTVLSSTGAMSGTFGSVIATNLPPTFAASVSYVGNTCVVTLTSTCDPCDANCDGLHDGADIQRFINRLAGGGGCSPCAGDMNGSGGVSDADVPAFVSCLLTP